MDGKIGLEKGIIIGLCRLLNKGGSRRGAGRAAASFRRERTRLPGRDRDHRDPHHHRHRGAGRVLAGCGVPVPFERGTTQRKALNVPRISLPEEQQNGIIIIESWAKKMFSFEISTIVILRQRWNEFWLGRGSKFLGSARSGSGYAVWINYWGPGRVRCLRARPIPTLKELVVLWRFSWFPLFFCSFSPRLTFSQLTASFLAGRLRRCESRLGAPSLSAVGRGPNKN